MNDLLIGLIVNPIAGIGGAVGLKGSDGESIQQQAISLGAIPVAEKRTLTALRVLSSGHDRIKILTYPGEMGESAAIRSGFEPITIGNIDPGNTKAKDTQQAVSDMIKAGVRLILFAGGDGTARDISTVIGTQLPVVGIPAGVKMHSAVFTNKPSDAGDLVALVLKGRVTTYRDAEVMDLDETSYRRGMVAPKLYGYLKVPVASGLVQNLKRPSGSNESEAQAAIASWLCAQMTLGSLYILGPGTTTRAITDYLGIEKTLIGVDVVMDGWMVQADANEGQLLRLLEEKQAKLIVTPVGGQGHIIGRGNQQISHPVINKVGRSNIIVACTPDKLHSLMGRPLLVDSGNETIDRLLTGYYRVVTGYNEQAMYCVTA